MASDLLSPGDTIPLTARGISAETCKKFGYTARSYNGEPVHIAPYYNADGQIVAQHLRTKSKEFPWRGTPKEALMFGQHLWPATGRMVVVTEGEIDAMSVSQVQDNRWPVVSIGCGAAQPGTVSKVTKYISRYVNWLEGYDKVIFMFDNDEQGKASAEAAASVLSPGKAFIATLPLKDANDMLRAGRKKEIIDAIWQAKPYRPDGLVTMADIMEEIMRPVEWGIPWCLDTLTQWTYGRRYGEVYGFGAGTGVGKTDFFTQQIAFDIERVLPEDGRVGVVYLEQKPAETAKRIAGKIAEQRFHIPDAGWTPEQLQEAIDTIGDKVVFYDNFGETDWNVVKGHIRYMAVSLGIKLVYLDHLTAMADPSNEKESLEVLMKEMAMLANELGVIIHFVSHLATPDGKPHEEGGRVMIRHFKGSRSIGFWSYDMFGLERDQQADDEAERGTTTFRCLKDRYTGQPVGKTFHLRYDEDTGMLYEWEPEAEDFTNVEEDCPF